MLRRRRLPWLLLENVPFMLHLGQGRALEVIIGGLEELGYRWAYRVVDSLAFGVPQRRERVFLVATRTDEDPYGILFADEAGAPRTAVPSPDLAYGFYWTEGVRGLGTAVDSVPTLKGGSTIGIPSPPAVELPSGRIVTPGIRDPERLQGFDPDWTKPAEAVGRASHRWKLVGNAVTVDVAEWIGRRLAEPGSYDPSWDGPLPAGEKWPCAVWGSRDGRFVAGVSTWPVVRPRPRLHEFLAEPRLLSAKATAGFWSRLSRSSLRRPDWFDSAIVAHLDRMQRLGDAPESSRRARGREATAGG